MNRLVGLVTGLILSACSCLGEPKERPNKYLTPSLPVSEKDRRIEKSSLELQATALLGYGAERLHNFANLGINGTAVIIDRGIAVTAAHVIWMSSKGTKYIALYEDMSREPLAVPFKTLMMDKGKDIAIIGFHHTSFDKSARIADKYKWDPRGFKSITAVKYRTPTLKGKKLWFHNGEVRFKDKDSDVLVSGLKIVYNGTGEEFQHGDSGSGIYNADGELIGILSAVFANDRCGIIPAETIREALNEIQKK